MIGYEVIIYWSEPDGCFLTEVPELAGCMADGATHPESLSNVERVADVWVEAAREVGRPIPAPRGRLVFA